MAARVPRVVWLLGLVSLCMDLSSEMIHALLPVFLTSVLGASMLTLGLIDGVAEGTASLGKIFSGVLSDRFRRRKPLVVFGYGLAALSKPLFALAQSPGWVLFARFIDRIGKGVRGSPRDAMLADATPSDVRGAAFGLRQSLDTTGALLGPLAAIGLMAMFASNVRAVFWVATVPAFAAVALLVLGVQEPPTHASNGTSPTLPTWRDLPRLGSAFWVVVAIGGAFALARFSEAFLVLRAVDVGLSLAWSPLALAVMNLTYVVSAYPAGRLSDRVGRTGLLAMGMVMLIGADVILAVGTSLFSILLGVGLWGLHLGLTQGLLAAMVADTAPATLRGSAFGVFHFITGLAALLASLVAGQLWDWHGPEVTFYTGASFSAVALGGLLAWRARLARP